MTAPAVVGLALGAVVVLALTAVGFGTYLRAHTERISTPSDRQEQP